MSEGYSESPLSPHHPKCSHRPFTHSEAPTGSGNFGFVDAPLTSTEVQSLKRELKPLLEDPHGVVD
jgi:hypothetical protein